MDSGLLPPFPLGLMSAAARDLARRGIQFFEAAQPYLPRRPAAAVLAAVSAAWLVNSMEWGFGQAQAMVAVCTGGLVATVAVTLGWMSEPEELERWVLRALAATSTSVLPLFM